MHVARSGIDFHGSLGGEPEGHLRIVLRLNSLPNAQEGGSLAGKDSSEASSTGSFESIVDETFGVSAGFSSAELAEPLFACMSKNSTISPVRRLVYRWPVRRRELQLVSVRLDKFADSEGGPQSHLPG